MSAGLLSSSADSEWILIATFCCSFDLRIDANAKINPRTQKNPSGASPFIAGENAISGKKRSNNAKAPKYATMLIIAHRGNEFVFLPQEVHGIG